MSTLASLASMLGQMPQIRPWDVATRSQTQADTGLLELADLKAKQQAEQLMLERIKTDPALAQQLFGTIASLPTMAAVPPGSALTQQTFGPGGPSGAAQVVPGGQDLSRFATQGGPPQSTLASLGPAGQPQMQGPQSPLLAMAQQNPRAAMMLQQQMQGAQERQWKTEERRLDMGVKIAEAVAQELNGVRDQASLDAARARVQQYHPQAAAQIPQFYSKEALEPLIMKGVAVKDLALWRKNMAQARQADMMTEQLPGTFKALEQFATGGGAQAPSGEAAAKAAAPQTGQQARSAPPEYESAITEANRLYPQVSPTRIKSIIAAESNFDPKAVSSAGAKGPMQLMDSTAKDMGVDDPFDITQNVRGGTRYYAQMLTRYGGDERKALTAYNWGPGNLDKVNGDVSQAPAETQAYVNRVLGGGVAGGGGATGTAQAPPANPKIAQIDSRIKEGQALALRLSATPGMEQAATMVNQQVNDLQQERNRLDAPRQEFLKKQAVQGLELEQKEREGLARAQLEADTRPASQAEIDAVNRSLPPDKRLPYGTTQKQLREQGRVGGQELSDTIMEQFTDRATVVRQLGELSTKFGAMPTGPWDSRKETFKNTFGIFVDNESVAYSTLLASVHNQLALARGGKALTPQEVARIEKELPTAGNPDSVFATKLQTAMKVAEDIYKLKAQFYKKAGRAVPDALLSPWDEGQAAPRIGLTPEQEALLKKHTR